jgi:hypothetical protein
MRQGELTTLRDNLKRARKLRRFLTSASSSGAGGRGRTVNACCQTSGELRQQGQAGKSTAGSSECRDQGGAE